MAHAQRSSHQALFSAPTLLESLGTRLGEMHASEKHVIGLEYIWVVFIMRTEAAFGFLGNQERNRGRKRY